MIDAAAVILNKSINNDDRNGLGDEYDDDYTYTIIWPRQFYRFDGAEVVRRVWSEGQLTDMYLVRRKK